LRGKEGFRLDYTFIKLAVTELSELIFLKLLILSFSFYYLFFIGLDITLHYPFLPIHSFDMLSRYPHLAILVLSFGFFQVASVLADCGAATARTTIASGVVASISPLTSAVVTKRWYCE
jgi:hypothetical protein